MMKLEDLKSLMFDAREVLEDARKEFLTTKAYMQGRQLDLETLNTLKSRGQPPLTENIYAMIANKIIGYKLNSITDIEVLGFQKEDRNLANLLTNILKSITQKPDYISFKEQCDLDLLAGIVCAEVWVVKDEFDNFQIELKNIPLESLYFDPFCQAQDLSDATYFIKVLKMRKKQAFKTYKEGGFNSVTNHTKTPKMEFVYIYEAFIKQEKSPYWDRYIFNDGRILSVEKNFFDIPCCPIVVRKLYTDLDNDFYGVFRDIKSAQDFINFGINRMANMMGSQKILFESSAVEDAEEFAYQVSNDNAVVRVNDGSLREGKISFQNNTPNIQALGVEINTKRELAKQLIGFNDEALGLANHRLSGVAVESRTNAGLVGLQRFLNASDLFDKQVFKVVLALITRYFTKAQVFKIVEKDTFTSYFKINDSKDTKIKVGSYDVEIATKIKTGSSRESRFMQWSELIKSGMLPPDLVLELLPYMLDDSDSTVSKQVREILDKKQKLAASKEAKEEAALQAQLQQQAQSLELATMQAKVKKDASQALKYEAQAKAIVEGDSGNLARD
ncbi:hypothetical protein [Helicobacter sp. 11S02629-2]|uniref:portal protein n=1 Tax=Helicobacter sp. 11S02629-2 TaxID=1476195 RepID=UPI000BC80D34|nr:hypothetical protein [Helicobacter sp. 11S02629-2]PAF42759.1 hypothetical protein BKH40_07645 [Helicobacter sp. 11S02629-2]